jgi:hypothetical protein
LYTLILSLHASYTPYISFPPWFDCTNTWYDMIHIFNRNWVDTRGQQYITQLHTNNTQNTEKGKLGSAGRAPSLRVIPWHLPYNWGKSTYYQAPHYEYHPSPPSLLLAPYQVQRFVSAPILKPIKFMVFL